MDRVFQQLYFQGPPPSGGPAPGAAGTPAAAAPEPGGGGCEPAAPGADEAAGGGTESAAGDEPSFDNLENAAKSFLRSSIGLVGICFVLSAETFCMRAAAF